MTQVILWTNNDGLLQMTIPTNELTIEEIKEKDTPSDSVIVDASVLPEETDKMFFGAWELINSTVIVNIEKAKLLAIKIINNFAKEESINRSSNNSIGIENKLTDTEWLNLLTNARESIDNATTTEEMFEEITLIKNAINDNKS